ncbi:MAG TPA: SDR family oxidoreductase [Candidatus Sulfopaludibacter sp.]|jgi:NAD(P)-dependent dehydrogenase (short-subunit alcohol dehydrogenase family)|nr:SDR family oxidoreductase [Candidatus Sulfopaludibacter sp.]
MDRLAGKKVIVTGGTRGIGRAVVERLLREGAAVAFCGRTATSVARAVEQMTALGRVFGLAADVTDYAQVRDFFRAASHQLGGLDILVNNAGEGVFKKVGEMTPEEWRRNIDLNLNGAFYCTHEALALFGTHGGFVVNISSLAAKNAFTGGAGYNASKAGLNKFTEALMLDHRHDNVRVCSIMPGSVDTEFGGDSAKRSGDTSWMIAPDDVAETVAMVLSMPERTMISAVEMRPSRPKK